MAGANKDLLLKLRARIRAFEDRKISAADVSREVYHFAREVNGEDQGQFRRSLEMLGNRIMVLDERSRTESVREDILTVIEELESELREWGH